MACTPKSSLLRGEGGSSEFQGYMLNIALSTRILNPDRGQELRAYLSLSEPKISLHPVVCCSLSMGCQPPRLRSRSPRLHLGANSASAARRHRRLSVDRSSSASDRRLVVGSVERASTTLTGSPLRANRAPTGRRPSAPATRGALWRILVFGVYGSLGGP